MNVEHGDSENYIGFARISNSHLLMKIAQHLLIAFLRSQSIGASYNELNAYLDAAIKTAIKDTLNSVKVEDSYSPITDAVIGIFRRDNDNIVAEDYDEYRKDDSMMFFRYKGEYFFKAEGLAAHLCKKLGKKYSSKQILSELDEFLTFNNEGVTRHLPHQLRKKKPENNQRFSALSKEALIDYIVSTSSSYFDYSGSPIKKLRKNEF